MRRLVLAACLVTLLAGCSALPGRGPPPSDDRAVAAVAEVNSTVTSVETYRFDSRMRVSASGGDRSRTVSVDGSGAVNVSSQRMRTTARMEDQVLESYVDERKTYRECPSPWSGYGVENLSQSEPWTATTPLHGQLALFERSNVYWRGNRTVDGNRTVLVAASPSADTVRSLVERRQPGDAGVGRGSIDNATARLWIDPDTNRPLKSELRLELSQGSATATAALTMRYAGYGDRVDITVPSAAYDDQHELGCPGT